MAVLGLGVLAPRDGLAQRRAPAFATWSAPARSAPLTTPVAFGHPDDYRWEGVLIGGVALGILGGAYGAAMCSYDNAAAVECFGIVAATTLLAGLTGAIAGGLLGGLIPKTNVTPP